MSDVTFNPYLNFAGNTREAMEFYHQVFGGELTLSTFSDIPGMPAPEGYEDKIMHAFLDAEDVKIMASEGEPGRQVNVGDNVNLSLSGADRDRLTTYFNDLSAGGEVHMPLADQPWGDTFGTLTDRFGIHWLVNMAQS